jgi:hypothetical protein
MVVADAYTTAYYSYFGMGIVVVLFFILLWLTGKPWIRHEEYSEPPQPNEPMPTPDEDSIRVLKGGKQAVIPFGGMYAPAFKVRGIWFPYPGEHGGVELHGTWKQAIKALKEKDDD